MTTWLSNIAFHLWLIWLQTFVAINSESCLTLNPSFCLKPSEIAVLFNSKLNRCPVLRQVVDLDLLLCIGVDWEHAALFLCHIFTCPSRAGELPQELGSWFSPLNFWLPPGTAFGEIARWQARPQTWTQTWTLLPDCPDQWLVQVLSPPKSQHELCGVWLVQFLSTP